MKKTIIIIILFLLTNTLFATSNKVDKTKEAQAKAWAKNQQLEFIENKGQFISTEGKPAENVLFKASYGNCDIYITDKGLSYVFVKFEDKEKEDSITNYELRITKGKKRLGEREDDDENKVPMYYRLDMDLVGADINKANIIKEEESKQGHYNYFYPQCPEGIYDVKGYGKITIKNIYKGIDWVIYTNSNNKEHPLKYDFIVHPNADYKNIKIKYLNAQSTSLLDNDTKLKIQTIAGNIEEGNIYTYQNDIKGIKSNYIINNDCTIAFEINDYDKTQTLVIDPLVWATYYGGLNHDGFRAICTDSHDNIFITGYSYSTDFPTMQLTGAFMQATFAGSEGVDNDIVVLKFNSQGVRLWATYYGGSSFEQASSICVDSQDNIYITGVTESSDFPTFQLTGAYWQPSFGGLIDNIILKFDNMGVRLWATNYGGSSSENANSICVDAQDNIYITGYTYSTNFPIQQLVGAYWQGTYSGLKDIFILKFNNQGVRLWATYYGGSGNDQANSISVDSQNNLYLTGFTTSYDFPKQQLSGAYWQNIFISGGTDAFILKFNSQDIRQWATYYGGGTIDQAYSICVDREDNIYIVGNTNSTNFPTQQLAGAFWQANIAGAYDYFILKFNNQGVRQWATYYGGDGDEGFIFNGFNFICSDSLGNIYITGQTYSTNLTTQQLIGEYWQPNLSGTEDVIILKFDKSSVLQWATYYGDSSRAFGTAVIVDKHNNPYFIGEWLSINAYTVDEGNGAYYQDTWNGLDDSYILKISPCFNTKPIALQTNRNNICMNATGTITLTAIGGVGDTLKWYKDACGQNYLDVNTPITIPIPTQSTTYYARWESACDTSACESITINIVSEFNTNINPIICQGSTFQVGQHLYSTTGNYKDTLTTSSGCDSIVSTNLSVNPVKQITLNPIICQGEVYIVGTHSYDNTGLYIDTLSTYLGCDSIVTTNLLVNLVYNNIVNKTICQGQTYQVGYNIYTTTGTYVDNLTTLHGCDSNITTNLTVNPTYNINVIKLICQGQTYQVGSNVYTIAGTYIDSLNTYQGCDSIITTNLNINPIYTFTVNKTICQGQTYQVGFHIYTITGTYVDSLTTYLSCDSIITTNLTVNPTKQITQNNVMCQGEVFFVGSHSYNITGIYLDTLSTYLGCDSIITTNLTVNPTKQYTINPVICKGEIYYLNNHPYTTTGIYIDSLTTYLGCDSIITANLTVVPSPTIYLGKDTTICQGQTILLNASYQNASYLWQDNSTNPTYNVNHEGIYYVKVSIDSNCFANDTINIIYIDCDIFIPNSFTPNGDGLNDVFNIKTTYEFSDYKLIIYDRWGELLFESDDINKGWDGTYKGKAVPLDVYIYQLTATIKDTGEQIKKTGRVTVVR